MSEVILQNAPGRDSLRKVVVVVLAVFVSTLNLSAEQRANDLALRKLFTAAFVGIGYDVRAEDSKQRIIALGDAAVPFLRRQLLTGRGENP